MGNFMGELSFDGGYIAEPPFCSLNKLLSELSGVYRLTIPLAFLETSPGKLVR